MSWSTTLGRDSRCDGRVVALGKEAKGLRIGQRVGVGWSAQSCLSCDQCLSGDHHLCATVQGTIVGRYGGFANYLRVQWTWARSIPDALDPAKTGPLLCGGITVFSPFLIHQVPATARVGVIGIGGLGHLALQFANKWGCEVHAFTTSDSKEAEARRLGAHHVHNTRTDGALKPLASSLDLIISTVNVPIDVPGLLDTLKPNGRLHVVGAILQPMSVPAFGLIMNQRRPSPARPRAARRRLTGCWSSARGTRSRRSRKVSPCRKSTTRSNTSALARHATASS